MFLQVICAPEFEIANFTKLKTGEGKERKGVKKIFGQAVFSLGPARQGINAVCAASQCSLVS